MQVKNSSRHIVVNETKEDDSDPLEHLDKVPKDDNNINCDNISLTSVDSLIPNDVHEMSLK